MEIELVKVIFTTKYTKKHAFLELTTTMNNRLAPEFASIFKVK